MSDNIKVVIRERPQMKNEKHEIWYSDKNIIYKKENKQSFQFGKLNV